MTTLESSQSNRSGVVLLLTATIQVGDVIFCDRRDTEVRLHDYLQAFRFWIGEPLICRIVFVENSGYDLQAFRELVATVRRDDLEVEFLSFVQAPFPRTLGKSYGEAKIVEFALQHSTAIARSETVIKCTGRYYATNFFRVWPDVEATGDSYVVVNFYRFPSECDSRIFAASKHFLSDYFSAAAGRIDDSRRYYFEMALADAATAASTDGRVVRAFPGGGFLIDGVQASTNSMYRYPYWKRLTYRVIALIRNGLPLRFRLGAPDHRPGQGSKT